MIAAKELKADHASILSYANSGDVTGDKRRVVGYLSALFLKTN
jgi:AmmeMemoRadiSam system protein B